MFRERIMSSEQMLQTVNIAKFGMFFRFMIPILLSDKLLTIDKFMERKK